MRILFATTVLMFVLPKIGIQCLRAWLDRQPIAIFNQELLGQGMKPFLLRRVLVANRPLYNFDKWIHYLKGNFDLIGPKPIDVKEVHQFNAGDKARFQVAPGIISLYTVKKRAGIAYQTEKDITADFVANDSNLLRMRLLVVSWIQRLTGGKKTNLSVPNQFSLFNVKIINTTMQNAVTKIVNSMEVTNNNATTRPATFGFVNADCANNYYQQDDYRNILNSFNAVFADGIGVKIAARLQGLSLRDNVNGTDMLPLLCEQLNARKKKVFLLGATKNVVRKTAEKFASEYPDLTVSGYIDGYSYNDSPDELCQKINHSNADLLLVAMGAPRQERWINDNIDSLNVKAVMGVGGLFDFYSGIVSRAPEWLRELSLEWVWRLAVQPLDKGKRYILGNPLFLMRVMFRQSQQLKTTKDRSIRYDNI